MVPSVVGKDVNGLTTGSWIVSGACAACGGPASAKVALPGAHSVTCPRCAAVTTLEAEFHAPPPMLPRLPWGRRKDGA